jgi:hypothetical protein
MKVSQSVHIYILRWRFWYLKTVALNLWLASMFWVTLVYFCNISSLYLI